MRKTCKKRSSLPTSRFKPSWSFLVWTTYLITVRFATTDLKLT